MYSRRGNIICRSRYGEILEVRSYVAASAVGGSDLGAVMICNCLFGMMIKTTTYITDDKYCIYSPNTIAITDKRRRASR